MESQPVERVGETQRILAVILVLNLGVSVAKLAVGVLTGSISMMADGFHSMTDAASNVVGLIAISWAAQPPDEDHPYGHWKYETLAALLIGGLLTLTAWEVLRSCVERLRSDSTPEVTTLSFVVMGVTIVINVAVATYEHRRGEVLGSELLIADAAHTRSDVLASLAVIASLIATQLGFKGLDTLVALAITAAIGHAAIQILRRSAVRLTDTAVVPAAEIEVIALAVNGVESVHKIRTRVGVAGGHADLHLQLRPDLPLEEAHGIAHDVVDRLRDELGLLDVVTHIEPYRD